MPSYNGQDYREKRAGSPEGSQALRDAAASLTMRVMVPWGDLVSGRAGKAFLGHCRTRTNGDLDDDGVSFGIYPGAVPAGAKYLSYANPMQHPEWNGYFYADGFSRFEGAIPQGQGVTGVGAFEDADIQIGFRNPPDGWRTLEDNNVILPAAADATQFPTRGVPFEGFCSRNMEIVETPIAKGQSIPQWNAGLVWSSDLRPAALAAYVPLFETRIKIEWYPVPIDGFNHAVFDALLGTTNLYPFPPPPPVGTPPSFLSTRDVVTLVMGPVGKKLIRTGDTGWAWKITLNLAYHAHGANFFYRYDRPDAAGGPGYDGLRRADPDLGTLFKPANWNPAFVPP